MCDKRGYPNRHKARQAVRTMSATVRVYWCDECHQYHTTKDRGGSRQPMRKTTDSGREDER